MNEIKLPKGVDRIAVTQHDDKIVIEFIPEEPKFKDGDFVYEDGRIMIVKSYPNNYHALVLHTYSDSPIYDTAYGLDFSEPAFRCATEDEKQLLIDALKKDGKRWNAEKLEIEDIPQPKFKAGDKVRIKDGISSKTHWEVEPGFISTMDELIGEELTVKKYSDGGSVILNEDYYEFWFNEDWLEPWSEEPKKGDWAIFWDNGYHLKPLIRLYHAKLQVGRTHFDSFGTAWDNAVKWDGTKEQFEKVLRGEI